jgi:hypothetical protein
MKKFIPFSNGTDAMIWSDNNCLICNRSGCYAKRSIEMGYITGYITVKTAEWIGIEYSRLKSKCEHLNESEWDKQICKHCGKYKTMQGDGIMHQLCECDS